MKNKIIFLIYCVACLLLLFDAINYFVSGDGYAAVKNLVISIIIFILGTLYVLKPEKNQ